MTEEAARSMTASGIEVPASAVAIAEELAQSVRAATVQLPFGAEPALYLALLEQLADDETESEA
jgi:hypothetical protein